LLSLVTPYYSCTFSLSFFYSYVTHRDLHSFPTRRSSDLARAPPESTRRGCSTSWRCTARRSSKAPTRPTACASSAAAAACDEAQDRKSTRLNSSHVAISYAVFCLKKKKKNNISATRINIS